MYRVVFQNTKECGNYAGVITWTSFKDDAVFEKWYSGEMRKRYVVIAKGVTPKKAIALCKRMPLERYAVASLLDIFNRMSSIISTLEKCIEEVDEKPR